MSQLSLLQAKALLDAGEKSWGTDEATFQRVVMSSSVNQLRGKKKEGTKLSFSKKKKFFKHCF